MYTDHTCPKCKQKVSILSDGRLLKDYEWCNACKDAHKKEDWAIRWFNHRFKLFTKYDIYIRDGFKCYICHRSLAFKDRNTTFDHEVPLARGGHSTFNNLRLCCNRCNNKKGDLLLNELFEHYGPPDNWPEQD